MVFIPDLLNKICYKLIPILKIVRLAFQGHDIVKFKSRRFQKCYYLGLFLSKGRTKEAWITHTYQFSACVMKMQLYKGSHMGFELVDFVSTKTGTRFVFSQRSASNCYGNLGISLISFLNILLKYTIYLKLSNQRQISITSSIISKLDQC